MHTAMCVVGKNYRLQDIQLSKTYDLQHLGWLAGPPPPLRSSGGTFVWLANRSSRARWQA